MQTADDHGYMDHSEGYKSGEKAERARCLRVVEDEREQWDLDVVLIALKGVEYSIRNPEEE